MFQILKMQNMKRILFVALCAVISVVAHAQITIKGHVVNERHEGVEYVTIGFEGDSIGTISDKDGHFTLTLPAKRNDQLVLTHVSYVPQKLSLDAFSAGKEVEVVLKDKIVALNEVVIGKHNKAISISKKAISGPSASLRGKGKTLGLEWGPVFKTKKDCTVSDLILKIKGSTYGWCVLSFNIYEMNGTKLRNILNKPIYYRLSKTTSKQELIVQPEEAILLKAKKKYYVSVAVVDSDVYGMLDMQSQMKTCYARRLTTGKLRKLPIGPAIIVKGNIVE